MDRVKFTNGTVLRGNLKYGMGVYSRYLFLEALGRESIVGWFEDDELLLGPNVKWIKPEGGVKQYNNVEFIVRTLVPTINQRLRTKLTSILRRNLSDSDIRTIAQTLRFRIDG